MAYFAYTVVLYRSYELRGGSVWSQLFDRLTTIPAEPALVTVARIGSGADGVNVVSDLFYYLRKYSGGGTGSGYTLERYVSAWTTPVTIGGFAEIYHWAGLVCGLAALFIAGYVLARMESLAGVSALARALSLAVCWVLFLWVVKGGLAYYLLNIGAVWVMLLAFGAVGELFTRRRSRRPRRPMQVSGREHIERRRAGV